MARQANGTYIQPANTAAVSSQTISSTAFNTLITDVGTEITNSLDRQGRSAMQAALPMGNNKITGMADPTVSTDGATKNYVDQTSFSTGDVKLTYKTTPDSGWLMMNDSTFGNTGSGAASTGSQYLALYTLLWNNISSPSGNAYAAVTGGLGVSAAADWAGLKSMSLPRTLGRALAVAGAGGGLTTRALGSFIGSETSALSSTNQLPQFTPSGSITNGTILATNVTFASLVNGGQLAISTASTGTTGGNLQSALNLTQGTSTFSGNAIGSASPSSFSIMQPEAFFNAMVKY